MQLELKHISKTFGPLKANDDLNYRFQSGKIYAILGENGAGKSTLMKIIAGYQAPDRGGQILLDGQAVQLDTPLMALERGIGMLYQDPLDFPTMTILENFLTARPGGGFLPNRAAARQELLALADRFGFKLNPAAMIESLTIGERQQLEILRLLALKVRFLILDEPTTGISAAQRQQLFQTLRQLATQDGLTIALVTHKLADVEALCDEGFILRRGRMVGQFDRKVSKGALVDMMFGTQAQTALAEPPPHHEASGPPLLKVSQLRLSTPLQSIAGIDLEVRPGEVIGLAGLEGSGQIPFMHHCAGLENTSWGGHLLSLGVFMGLGLLFAYLLGYSSTLFVTSLAVLAAVLLSPLALALLRSLGQSEGGIFFQGRPLAWQSYRDLRRQGLAYLSSGRLEEGLISGLSLTEHTALAEGGNPLWVNWRAGRAKTEAAIRTYDIRGQAHSPIQTLSGGNQQRVALSLLPPYLKLAFLENPTRGLDVQSAAHIWNLLLAGRDEGMAIVFSSPDLDEIVKYSDRVLVFASGACTLVEGRLDPQYLGWLIGGSQGEMQHD